MTVTAELDATAAIHAALQSQADATRAAWDEHARLAAEISYISAPADEFSSLPYALKEWGPKAGYNWAVQRVVASGLGTSDYLTVYKGRTTSENEPQNALYTFTVTVAGAVATWQPGKTGAVLLGRERGSLMFGGSIAGTVTVSIDVIQVTDEYFPYFLAG